MYLIYFYRYKMSGLIRKIFRKKRGVSKKSRPRKAVRQNVNVQGTVFDHLGSGSYGCVVKPANLCSKPNNTISPDSNYVAKYMTEKGSFDKEIHGYDLMKKADPNGDFSIVLKEFCDMDVNDRYIARNSCSPEFVNNMAMNISNSTPSYKMIIEKGENAVFSPKGTIEEDIFRELLEMMLPIFKGLVSMKNAGIIHADIKGPNMVIKNNKFKLIDYGLMATYAVLSHTQFYFEIEAYRYWPREIHMIYNKKFKGITYDEQFWNVDSLKNTSRVIDDKEFDLSKVDVGNILADMNNTYLHCLYTFDVYGLGITIYEFMVSAANVSYSTMTSPAKELIKMMATPRVYERATPEQVLQWVNSYLGI